MCNNQNPPAPPPKPTLPKIVTITLSATNAVPEPLTITDTEGHTANTSEGDAALTTFASRGDTIRWDRIEGITAIRIYRKSGPNLFSRLTPPDNGLPQAATWVGVVDANALFNQLESYSIDYYVTGQNNPDGTNKLFTQDPRIEIKP
ncbi:MAG TPA: hypothetical protein PKD85_13630 [Saprospiraceae bacterium]|nr:hypothetical protein [Saprospiraceae bacterium]